MTGQFATLGRNIYPTRVAMFQVLVVYDDYLHCRGYDPDAQTFLNFAMVAKPLVLQKTPWDGKTYGIGGVDATFTYDDPEEWSSVSTSRSIEYVDGEDTRTVAQTMSYPYFVGDILAVAKPVTKIGETPGAISESDCALLDAEIQIMYDDDEKPIAWMDLNVAGRGWVESQVEYRGKLDGPLAAGDSATVSIWRYTDEGDADTDVNVTAYDWLLPAGYSLEAGSTVFVQWFGFDQRCYVVGWQPATETVVTQLQVDGANAELEKKTIEQAIAAKKTESDWSVWHTGDICP